MEENELFNEKGITYSLNRQGTKIQVRRKSILEPEKNETAPEVCNYKSRRTKNYDNVDSAGEEVDEEADKCTGAIEY